MKKANAIQTSRTEILVTAIMPLVTLVLVLVFMQARSHFYINTNSDPAYLYLNNSLNLALGKWSEHVDNPGSTTQIVGGITIKTLTTIGGVGDIEREVLLHPEYYLEAINAVLVAMNLIALFLLGFFALKWTGKWWVAILLQCAPFASWQTLRVFVKVSPEPLSFFAAILLTIVLLRIAVKNDISEKPIFYTVWFSIVAGFGLATKLTFIPLLFIPLILIPGLKWKGTFILATLAAFHIFIFPAYKHYGYLFGWARDIFVHSGHYGNGEANFVDVGAFFQHFKQLLLLHHSFFATAFTGVAMLIYLRLKKGGFQFIHANIHVRLLLALSVAMMVHLLMISKHYNPHYLVPSFTLLPFLVYLLVSVWKKERTHFQSLAFGQSAGLKVALICGVTTALFIRHFLKDLPGSTISEWLTSTILPNVTFLILALLPLVLWFVLWFVLFQKKKAEKSPSGKWLTVVLLVTIAGYHIRHIDLPGFYKRLDGARKEARALENVIAEKFANHTCILGERTSSKLFSLRYGATVNFQQHDRYHLLSELYKEEEVLFWGVMWKQPRQFYSWADSVAFDSVLLTLEDVILLGDTGSLNATNLSYIENTYGVKLENVFNGQLEQAYEIKRGHENEQ